MRNPMLRQLRSICWNENVPVHASPPDCLDVSLPSECELGPRKEKHRDPPACNCRSVARAKTVPVSRLQPRRAAKEGGAARQREMQKAPAAACGPADPKSIDLDQQSASSTACTRRYEVSSIA